MSLSSLAENQRCGPKLVSDAHPFWRVCSRMIRNTFPRYAACILTMHAGWKSLRADARARLLALSPCTLTLVHSHVGIVHLSSTEPSCSGEIPIFYPRSGLRCQLDGFVPVGDLYEFRLPTIFTRTVVRARHRVIMILLRVHSNT